MSEDEMQKIQESVREYNELEQRLLNYALGEDSELCICGRVATTEYGGVPSCGKPACEYKIQQAADYHEERGNG